MQLQHFFVVNTDIGLIAIDQSTSRLSYSTGTVGAVYQHWWRSVPALVAQCTDTGGAVYRYWWRSVTGTGGAVSPALVA